MNTREFLLEILVGAIICVAMLFVIGTALTSCALLKNSKTFEQLGKSGKQVERAGEALGQSVDDTAAELIQEGTDEIIEATAPKGK